MVSSEQFQTKSLPARMQVDNLFLHSMKREHFTQRGSMSNSSRKESDTVTEKRYGDASISNTSCVPVSHPMRLQLRRSWIIGVSMIVVLMALPLLVWGTKHVRESARGNSRISFYGRVVNADGEAIPGMEVTFYVASAGDRREYYGGNEVVTQVSTMSDMDGNFHISGVYGRKIGIKSFKLDRREYDFAFPPGDPRRVDTGFVTFEKTSAAQLPATSGQRITYFLIPHLSPSELGTTKSKYGAQ